jgi:transcriptional regulator with XRE-family HTH domain
MSTADAFRGRLHAARPDIAERARGNEVKRKLALALRALRKERGMTQRDLEARSGLTQSMVSRLEAPTGSLPNWDTVLRYVEACDGHMMLGFSLGAFDEAALLRRRRGADPAGGLVSAVAV